VEKKRRLKAYAKAHYTTPIRIRRKFMLQIHTIGRR